MKRNGLTTRILLTVLLLVVFGVPVHGGSNMQTANLLAEGMT